MHAVMSHFGLEPGGGLESFHCAILCAMTRVFVCATALLASFCFVVPRPENPRFPANQLRQRKTERHCKQTAAMASATLCFSLAAGATSLAAGLASSAAWPRNNRRGPPRQCRLRSAENESRLLMAEARRLRAEAARLEGENLRANKLMMACGGLELVQSSQVQDQPDFSQLVTAPALEAPTEHVQSRIEFRWEIESPRSALGGPGGQPVEDFEHRIPVMDHSLRLLATLPYLLPAIDAWCFFGVGIAYEAWPALYMEWMSLSAEMPQDCHYICAALYPVLLFGMPLIAGRRWLPELLRFNLNQAFLFSGILRLAFHLSSFSRWLAFLCAGDEAVYVPAAAEPPLMPGGHVLLPLMVACIVYSIYCTLCEGSSPDKIPLISAEARRSLGTSPTVLRSKSCSSFLERKARSHKILPGDRRDDTD